MFQDIKYTQLHRDILKSVYRCVNLDSILQEVILLTSKTFFLFYCQRRRPVTFSFQCTFDKEIYNISV
jgi:hypothetical protein